MISDLRTGDQAADALLRLIVTFARSLPPALREEVRGGLSSLSFNFRYLAHQASLDLGQVIPALELLEELDCIRCDYGNGQYGARVWLRARLEEAA